MSLSLFNYAISSSFSASAGNIYTSSIVSITGITSGSITFTPAFSSFNNYASASLLWLSGSIGPGPFYNVSGGYFTNIDPQAFSSSFSFSNSTTLVTQSNSPFYFDSSSIVGYPNSQFQITYLTGSATANQTLVVDRVVDFYIDTGSGENTVSFKNLIYNYSTQDYDFQTYTSIKGGIETIARGTGSFAVGTSSLAQGNASVAEGIGTLATGLASHAAGINTTASGVAAFSMGVETDADGTASFAAGSGSWARGTATVAFGIGTVASSSGQLVVGHYNEAKTDINNLFVVGDGTGPLSANRRNIIEVYGGQGAGLRGVKIDTAATPTITTTIDGFNVYGQTYLRGNTDILTNKITSTGDTSLGTSGSIIFEAYNLLPALVGRTVMDWKGINFDDAFGVVSPGSTYLWRNSLINHLYYSSSQLIQDGGNNTGTVVNPLLIGTTNASNLELETNNTTRVFISSSGNVGIGETSPSARLEIRGSGATSATTALRVENSAETARLTILDDGTSAFNTNHLYVSSSGLVGIGTILPSAELHVSGASADNLLRVGSPTNSNILFVNGNGRVGINTTSSADFFGGNISTFTIFQNSGSGDGLTPSTGLQIINSGSSTSAQAQLSIVTVGDKFAALNIGTSGSGTDNNYWHLSKRNAAGGHALNLYNNNNGSFSSPLFSFVKDGISTLGESYQIRIDDANDSVGLQVVPSDWIHLSSDPAASKYLNIDAAQTSNAPPLGPGTAGNGFGIVSNDNYLAEPDYWMEIKLGGTIVLIPCYLPG